MSHPLEHIKMIKINKNTTVFVLFERKKAANHRMPRAQCQ